MIDTSSQKVFSHTLDKKALEQQEKHFFNREDELFNRSLSSPTKLQNQKLTGKIEQVDLDGSGLKVEKNCHEDHLLTFLAYWFSYGTNTLGNQLFIFV